LCGKGHAWGKFGILSKFQIWPKFKHEGQAKDKKNIYGITLKKQKRLERCTISEEVGVHNGSDKVEMGSNMARMLRHTHIGCPG
jgi:hypothetical protein